jgi:asparagine N-glycosylation enzyme membrane subunit Stt3
MSSQLIKLSRIAGTIALFLGAVHETYTFWFIPDVIHLPLSWRGLVLYMYLATGLACILAGCGIFLSTARSIQNLKVSNHIYLISATFMLLLGIGAPITMNDNPFGYISLTEGVFSVAVGILRYRQPMS